MELKNNPYNYIVIDNFFEESLALKLSEEFLDFNSDVWFYYNNPIENKKTLNHWDKFPKTTYKVFSDLCSENFISKWKDVMNINSLYPDVGLHGGGWHIHSIGGKLNVHKDYSIHPKLGLQRKLNLIVYLTPGWNPEWGGALEFWSHDEETNQPKEKITEIDCLFNRAVIFDTTQNSWHGLPNPLKCPEGIYRKSIAVYYLTDPPSEVEQRNRALFVPTEEQKNNKEVLDLIDKRSKL